MAFTPEDNDPAPRREFLGKLAALGTAAMLPGELLAASKPKPFRIDVHHHLIPPGYLDEVGARRQGGGGVKWSPQLSIEDMDKNRIEKSVLSIVQPAVWFGDVDQGRKLARECNEYGAQLAHDHPGRFGSFAQIPLPDADGSLKEIEYAFGTLKADGIGLMTSYQDKYLGDASFAPVYEELNRRKAVVYTHPLTPDCCRNVVKGLPPGVIEYATDTTRTIASLVFSGTAARYPDIRWIFSHSGGTMPFLLSRFEREEATMKEREQRIPHGFLYELKKFHYDTAQGNHRGALDALTRIAAPAHILFGTDFPFRPGAEEVHGLGAFFKAKDLRAIERGNALRLMPTLKA
jgi:predicted TIM-barrel fold metal-dependent hydrolase